VEILLNLIAQPRRTLERLHVSAESNASSILVALARAIIFPLTFRADRTSETLGASGVQVIELRASIVIGSGSLSFEMIRALVERLPIMITPRWVGVKAQPVAIMDLLEYLHEALEIPMQDNRIFEIGGADQVSYGELMQEYARQRGLRRLMIPVPVLTPRLSSLWLGLVTPLYARTGRKLVESLRHSTTVQDPSAVSSFRVKPRSVHQAIAEALKRVPRPFRSPDPIGSGPASASLVPPPLAEGLEVSPACPPICLRRAGGPARR
jgi:hypothetical protein